MWRCENVSGVWDILVVEELGEGLNDASRKSRAEERVFAGGNGS